MDMRYLTLALGLFLAIGTTPTRAESEFVLIPVTFASGAHGTKWETELAIYNPTNETIDVEFVPCPLSPCFQLPVHPGTTLRPLTEHTASERMFVLVVPSPSPLSFTLRALEGTGACKGWGTSLPVPRVDEFGQRFSLLEIPTSAQYRANLRLYLVTEEPNAYSMVTIVDSTTNELLATQSTQELNAFLTIVGGKYIKNIEIPDIVGQFPSTATAERLRIEITSVGGLDSSVGWGFVSVTDNVSQQVTVITP